MKVGAAILTCVAFALGTGLGWLRTEPERPEAAASAPLPTKTVRRAPDPKPSGGTHHDDVAELDGILSLSPPAERLRALVRFANRIPAPDLHAWVARGLGSGDRLEDDVLDQIIATRLQISDPGALFTARLKAGEHRINDEFLAWVRDDPTSALSYLLEAHPRLQWRLGELAIKEWAKTDPERALALLDASARRGRVELAWSLARALPPMAGSHRDELAALARDWPSQWRICIQTVAAKPSWIQDPAGTVAWMRKENMSAEVFARMVGELDNSDRRKVAPDLLDHIEIIPEAWLDAAARRRDYAVVRTNPKGWLAADASELGIDPALLDRLQRAAAGQLRSKDGDPVALMAGQSPAVQAALAVTAVNRGYYSDPKATEAWIASLELPEVREAAEQRFRVLDAPDDHLLIPRGPNLWPPQREILPVGETPAEQLDRVMRERIAGSDRYNVPLAPTGEAFHHVLAHAPDTVDGDTSTRLIDHAVRWAQDNAPTAADWAVALPATPEREWALRNVARQWAAQAPSEVRTWAESLPDPADRALVLGELPEP